MKIVKIIGGLGNQMFQYAFAVSLKQHFPNEEILFDCTYMKNYNLHNGLELNTVFDIDMKQCSIRQLIKITRPVRYHKLSRLLRLLIKNRNTEYIENTSNKYSPRVFDNNFCYYEGYWQNPKYFEDYNSVLLNDFQFKMSSLNEKSKKVLDIITSCNSVSIHVRRGDYLKNKVYKGCADLEYYKKAVCYILSNVEQPFFFVFSDDIEWCKKNMDYIIGTPNIFYVDWNKGKDSYQDMLLISKCQHNIIANSSFSWWAAYLNPNRGSIVCCPNKWNNLYLPNTIQCENWIQI